MKLQDLQETISNTQTVINMLKQQLPGISVAQSNNGIEISKWNASEGETFLDLMLQKSNVWDAAQAEIEFSGNLDNTLQELGNRAMKKFVNLIPDGWKVSTYDLSNDADIVRIEIRLERDSSRKSRSKSTTWYHVTPLSNMEHVRQSGLEPRSSTREFEMGTYRNKIFLLSNQMMKHRKSNVIELVKNLQGKFLDSWRGHDTTNIKDVAIFKVNMPKDVDIRLDRTAHTGAVYTEIPISPDQLTVVYQGSIDGIKDMDI